LIANSAIVHADETSWSLKSVWAFLSEQARLLLFGVNKDAETLKRIIDADVFKGILFSDDAAVYSRFTQMQKCWAHLIRKAIKLTLQDGEDRRYRLLADGLLKIHRDARAIQSDAKLDDAGKLAQGSDWVANASVWERVDGVVRRARENRGRRRLAAFCWLLGVREGRFHRLLDQGQG